MFEKNQVDLNARGLKDWQRLTQQHPDDNFNKHKEIIVQAFGLSDFIARIATQYAEDFALLLPQLALQHQTQTADYGSDLYKSELASSLSSAELEPQLHQQIRKFRHLTMLKIAWTDMLLHGDIKLSLLAVSELARVCINQSYEWLYNKASERYGLPQRAQQMLILGMGKLGGQELNFSSDIDLIFVFPDQGETDHPRKPIEHSVFFTKLAQKLIASLHQTTVDGQAYRVDMRLRPLGESGPIVISMPAFETYYQEQGREWERFAMQKAQILNNINDINKDDVIELLSVIKPFVYRKYLDFTTLESLREMKNLIETDVKRRHLNSNIKLGKGGIREVEFFVQCHQLIHAGKITECQTSSIFEAFQRLVEHHIVDINDAQDLQNAYLKLRKIEHYLQAFDDKQTQTLPDDDINQQRLCVLLKLGSYKECLSQIDSITQVVNSHFKRLISQDEHNEGQQETTDNLYQDLWTLPLSHADTIELLSELAMPESAKALADQLIDFKQKVDKASQSERSKRTLNKLVPLLMNEALPDVDDAHASQAIPRLLSIIDKLIGRTTYLDLLAENHAVRTRLIKLCAKSEWIALQISRFPLLLDELLHPAYLKVDANSVEAWKADYKDALRLQMLRVDPFDVEEQMDTLRYFKLTQQLRIAAADATGTIVVNKVSDKLTVLAEVILAYVVDMAWRQVTDKYGAPHGTSSGNKCLGVIAYGKMGGLEMGYGSDIDMVCIHTSNPKGSTDGQKQVSTTEFFVKLVQRISHIFTANTYLGQLYEIDLRLRPSGNSGLLVSHIESFEQYQISQAWTWEHQALTRSRCVYGEEKIGSAFSQIRESVLRLKRDPERLRIDVVEMRSKMRSHLDKTSIDWLDIKQTKGGITDLEFLVQYWILKYSHDYPSLTTWSDNLRMLDSLCAEGLLQAPICKKLQTAYLSLRNEVHALNLKNQSLCRKSTQVQQHLDCINEYYQDTLS